MVLFPNCKINLGLSIINKRNDGYHNLETVFYPLALKDVLEIIPVTQGNLTTDNQETELVNFSASGLKIDGGSMDNLCLKAYYLLRKDFPQLHSINMHLHKAIPMGAGLGGGSADGAFTLKLLNKLFNLGLSTAVLLDYALKLGSDCPFFILNRPCFASGRGEILEQLDLDLSAFSFLIVNGGISVNTGWAFAQLDITADTSSSIKENLKDVLSEPVNRWKNTLVNDFEKPVFEKYPILKLIKDQLYAHGALYASMSGSGSTIFGIFEKNNVPDKLAATTDLHLQVVPGFL